jgi:hypothetical protein
MNKLNKYNNEVLKYFDNISHDDIIVDDIEKLFNMIGKINFKDLDIKLDINMIKYKEDKNYLETNYLKLNFIGDDIDHIVINTLRRIMMLYIPIYAYDNIVITKNTTIYNNDMIKLRLSLIPITLYS